MNTWASWNRQFSQMQLSLSAKIIRNVLSSGLRALVLVPVPFVMTPLILSKVGPAGYGTWAVLMAINNLTSLADLGMVGTVSKYVAEYHAHQDFQSLNRLVNTGLAVFLFLSSLVGLLIWFGSPLIVHSLFRGSPLRIPELVVLLRIFLIVISANILTLLFSSVTSGLQRLDISNWISTINILGAALIGGTLLLLGWGLRGLALGQVFSAILTVAIYSVVVKKLLPETVLGTGHVDAAEAKKMFNFSLRLYITQAAVAVHNQLEKFLLALFVGVAAAGWYDIASDLALKLRGLVGLVLGPVLPAASELDARNDQQRLAELYYRAQKYVAFFGLPLVFYVSIVSRKFVELWVGPKLAFISVPLAVLMWVNLYNLLTGPGFLILAGRGFLKPGIQSALVGLGLNVFLSVGLIYRFGFAGAVVGTSVSLMLASTFFLYLFHAHTGYSVGRLIREAYLKPFATAAALALPMWLVLRATAPSWGVLLVLGFVFLAFYVTAIFLNRFLDQYEWGKIEGLIPAVRHFRRIIPLA
jgi:O-antigen/teichoic acid export membrane protein